jgi:hypothetical protein
MRAKHALGAATLLTLVGACGGDGSGGSSAPAPTSSVPPAFTAVSQVRISLAETFDSCAGVVQTGMLYPDTALEPSLVVNPANRSNLIAAWQENRWDTGGSQALELGASFDGGTTWELTNAAFSICTGGSANNAGDYLRASNGWLAVSPAGMVYALSLSFTGGALQPGSSNAQLVARSSDGGVTWSPPIALITDQAGAFNDKGSISADPTDSNYVYAVWDRLNGQTGGPTYFAVTSDAGNSWQTARSIYDPGIDNQTIGNVLVVLPNDILVDLFTEIDNAADGVTTLLLRAIRSTDHGASWSQPVTVAEDEAVGAVDPQTGTPIRDSSLLFSAAVAPGGTLYMAWQDARFSSGAHDGVALSSSSDGGMTWSAPIEVNGDPAAVTFTPTINVRADGVIGITYYDLRNDTFPGKVLTDCWMVTSSDGKTFTESHLSGPFDLNNAPRGEFGPNNTLGLFLGDYQALASSGSDFLPLYAQTNTGSSISSDVFIDFPPVTLAAEAVTHEFRAMEAPPAAALTPAARQKMSDRIRFTRNARLPR